MRGIDLRELSKAVLKLVGPTAIEVQAMHVDGQVAITANNAPLIKQVLDTKAKDVASLLSVLEGVPKEVASKLADPQAQAGAMLNVVKTSTTRALCAEKMATRDRSLVLLYGEDLPVLHAEQSLLVVLAEMLKDGRTVDTIHIWGAKEPCGSCLAVLKAFSHALDAVYEKTIIFSTTLGQDREVVPTLSLTELYPAASGKFALFIRIYQSKLAELRR